ncbi:MAG: AsmA family protein [Gammaproteobacteria bacterium]|nr:AsmA family protein [Gammaproteobacteria bacterium]MBU1603284.1 AsmA family protein [Gammaproteobacteria bacterium]MBU2432804.1 AsmA family protein [Gammaproteobacteria bacterium]MBU2450047.1 AsmA family protein [Gammaproteobacteria bacterium]
MTVLRKIGIGGAVLVGVLVVAIGVLYAMFDEAAIKRQLVDQVAAKTGRQLSIDGELRLSVWPDVAVRVSQVRLSEADGKSEFFKLGAARIAVAVLPLLSKELKVKRVEIDGLAVNLIKRKDGSLNIDDLNSGDKTAGPSPTPAGQPATPLDIDVAGLALRDARLTWHDETTGKTTEISDLDLSTGALSGNTGSQHFAVDQFKLATRGSIGPDQFVLTLEAPGLKLTAGEASGDALTLSATLEGAGKKIVSRIALDGLAGSLEALSIRQFAFGLDAALGESSLKADLASPVAADGKARTIVLDKLSGAVEVASPALPMKQLKLPLAGRLAADLGKQRADLALATGFDESKIDLKLAVERFAPLALGFALDIDRLNVDRYLPPKPAGQGGGAGKGGAAPEAKIDLAALKGLDVQGTVKVGQLQANKLKLSGLDARIEIAAGRLQVAPLRARLYGGSVDGSVSVDAAGNRFAVRQNLRGIDISPLLKDLADKDILEGRGSVSLDVTTRGDTVSALKRGLAGQAGLDLRDGAIKGINLAKLLRQAKAALSGKQALSGSTSAAEKTDFSELTATFRIDDGVARNKDLALKSPFLRLAGEGEIDIGRDSVDYHARISVVDSATGQTGQELAFLKGITVPLRLRGPYGQLAYTLELDKLLQEAAKTQLKQKAQEVLGKELQKLFGK